MILAVLAGVLAMHGLGMAGPGGPSHHPHTSASAPSSVPRPASMADVRCGGPDDGGMPEHRGHADQLCLSGAVPGGPVAPVPVVAALPGTAEVGRAWDVASEARAERAPPTLSELQLLRI
jgi:hypothetical protein